MIYDCFPFFNELDLLEIRLNELDSVVDKFVLVESTKTFQKQDKPIFYAENKDRFKQFSDKIINIVIDKFPVFSFHKFRMFTSWDYSNYQKNQIIQGLKHCQPDDVIIVSDMDEIPRASKVLEFKDKPGIKIFQQKFFNYFLNCAAVEAPNEAHLLKKDGYIYWKGTVMLNFKDFTDFKNARLQRNEKAENIHQVEEGGWHFSFLGDWKQIIYKLNAWEHAKELKYSPEYLRDPDKIKEIINNGEDLFGRDFKYKFIDLDDSYPKYLINNKDKFRHLIQLPLRITTKRITNG